jgi:translation initiation factor IF-2
MDKVRIQEIALEAGLSNNELLEKAKELGFAVKAANSAISMDEAGVLVDYAISGTLPKGFKKPGEKKAKITVVKKEESKAVEPSEEKTAETSEAEVPAAETPETEAAVEKEEAAPVEEKKPETPAAEEKPAPKKEMRKLKVSL